MIGERLPAVRRALRPAVGLLPRRADYVGLRRSWSRDLAAGVTVGVVALPLATAVRVVILRLASVAMLDATGARVLGEIVEDLHRRGITVLVKGGSAEHRRLLAAVGTLAPLVERGHVFATFPEALAHATRHVAADRDGAPTDPFPDPGTGRPRGQELVVMPTAVMRATAPKERMSCDRC